MGNHNHCVTFRDLIINNKQEEEINIYLYTYKPCSHIGKNFRNLVHFLDISLAKEPILLLNILHSKK